VAALGAAPLQLSSRRRRQRTRRTQHDAPRSCDGDVVIAISGLRTSLQQIADTAGILPGSLYHHFESKEAILVELVRGEARRAGPARSLIHLRDNVLRGMVARGA
jgi:AcrR family transcriptional regulator